MVAMAQDGGLALLASWALVAPLPPSWAAAPEPSTGGQVATAPLAVKFIRERGGKPPMRFVDVTLELRNTRDRPLWLVTRYYGDEPLPADGRFQKGWAPQPFGGRGYDGAGAGGRGVAVEVHFLGEPSFRAFHLPAGATVRLEDYAVEAWSDVTEVEFWEASSLLVNGRTPLERWLPYPTLSDAKAAIPAGTGWKTLDWDPVRLASRTDYPREAVTAITATVLKKWTIPITGVGKAGGK